MKASETNFLKFLQGQHQYVIPIYQRTYSWTLKECGQLWKDLTAAAADDTVSGHFVGSIVYIERGLYQVTAVPQLLVIDGQQRLTTLSLLLCALGRAFEASTDGSEMTRKKLNNYYLFNDEEVGEKRYKLLLTKSDKDTFARLIENREPPQQASRRIQENYRFFEDQIAKVDMSPDDLYRALGKLIIVDIALDREHDNPQLIFESLNSTGLDLSQADLIRNYVLMGQEPPEQARLYNDYWYPMEQAFGHAEYAALFDRFMRDFLTLKTGAIPNISEVYQHFKSHVHHRGSDTSAVAEVVADVAHYSRHFVALAFARDDDPDIRAAILDVNTLKVDVVYPLLLKLLEDYGQQLITKTELLSLLRLVEAYVFRRAICGIPTNSLNKTFANLPREIDERSYIESVYAAFLLKDSYRRLPLDEEFRREFVVKDLYNFRSRNYLLSRMENHNRKERVDVGSYTIEHVLPQNPELSEAWRRDLGDDWKRVQQELLHTIGNLTLTGYNSELSDRPFRDKQKMPGGFADSPIRLNRGLAQLSVWNEDEIRNRAVVLSDLAVEVWKVPHLPAVILDQYRSVSSVEAPSSYTLADHANMLQGEVLTLFESLRKRILNLDASVREEVRKSYIAYKTVTNFVDIVPQRARLRLTLNMRFADIDDPLGICEDVSDLGHWGNGDVEVGLAASGDLDYAMGLIQQAFDQQSESLPGD